MRSRLNCTSPHFMLTLLTQSVFLTWLVNNTGDSVLMATLNYYAVNISGGIVVTALGLITWDTLGIMESISYSIIAITLIVLFGPRTLLFCQLEDLSNNLIDSSKDL